MLAVSTGPMMRLLKWVLAHLRHPRQRKRIPAQQIVQIVPRSIHKTRVRLEEILEALPSGLAPGKIYADRWESYASNEICINWQASLVFLLAGEL